MKTSLDHLPRKKQRELARVVDILHEEFDAVVKAGTAEWKRRGRLYKIILFGSYARGGWVDEQHVGKGYQSDYDILVVVSHKKLSEGTDTGGSIWRAAEDRIERDRAIATPVQVIVHTLDEVNTELKKGRYFFKEVRADGIALYEFTGSKSSGNRHHALADPGNLTPNEVHEAAKEYFEFWFPSATSFVETFGFLLKRKEHNHAAFELHPAPDTCCQAPDQERRRDVDMKPAKGGAKPYHLWLCWPYPTAKRPSNGLRELLLTQSLHFPGLAITQNGCLSDSTRILP